MNKIDFFFLTNKNVLESTTHLGIGAHPDDLEIMAYHGILECYEKDHKNFFGIICTDGSGSPRSNKYKDISDNDMINIRKAEQKKAATIGKYNGVAFLNYKSSQIKENYANNLKNNIKELIQTTSPEIIYTHSLTDTHQTHLSVAIQTINAIRELPTNKHPKKLYGCEVWDSLEWLTKNKVLLDVSSHTKLATKLLRAFDSQISGGKRYDLATIGRRVSNATFSQKNEIDQYKYITYAMDLTPLIKDKNLSISRYTQDLIDDFKKSIDKNFQKLGYI